jgi:DNA polymerase-3 subunit alpha
LADFIKRTGAGLEQLVLLIRAGGFRFTGCTPQALLWEAHFLLGSGPSKPQQAMLFNFNSSETFRLPPLEHGELERAFDQIELLGFPLSSPFDLLTPEAQRIAQSATAARDLPQYIGRIVSGVGYLVTVKETRTIKGERMCFGCFIDRNGDWLDSVHFPPALRQQDFRGRGIYRLTGLVREEWACFHIEVNRLEKLAYIPDPRYAEGENAMAVNRRPTNKRGLPSARSAGTALKRTLRSQ